MHNTQPWRFRLDAESTTVEIHADAGRALPHEDPHGRALHIAAGAALFNLRVAVSHFGWKPVTRLLPDPRHPGLLASVHITGRTSPRTLHGDDLYEAIWHRRSSRFPFGDQPVPVSVRHELAEAAQAEGATLAVTGPRETARLLRITTEAERRNHADPARSAESRRWSSRDGAEDTGIPSAALGPQDTFEQLPMRDFSARRSLGRLPARPFERTPAFASLSTGHDRRTDWLRAGQALECVLLVATAHGLRTSLLHQALEWTRPPRRPAPRCIPLRPRSDAHPMRLRPARASHAPSHTAALPRPRRRRPSGRPVLTEDKSPLPRDLSAVAGADRPMGRRPRAPHSGGERT
ncbi:Acg family FMN-binding oxidoreductase [Streptomyces sp. NPDC020794]|uniref:Acg family FMN-binding oxidoreductase n=1 Tax=unclassified Streptomyces TaxID=2593676 RepID=UPI0036E8ED69